MEANILGIEGNFRLEPTQSLVLAGGLGSFASRARVYVDSLRAFRKYSYSLSAGNFGQIRLVNNPQPHSMPEPLWGVIKRAIRVS